MLKVNMTCEKAATNFKTRKEKQTKHKIYWIIHNKAHISQWAIKYGEGKNYQFLELEKNVGKGLLAP